MTQSHTLYNDIYITQEWHYMESKQLMQGDWCLQARSSGDTGDHTVTVSLCKDGESDNDKDHYPQLWLFEQVS